MQLSKFKNKSFKGFTLIELLVVIAIIGLLSTIVAAPVQSARKKAKDTKKVAEMKQLATALANYTNDNSQFPNASSSPTLTALTPTYIPALPSSLGASAARDRTYYTSYRASPPGAGGSYRTMGYHMGSTLEVYNTVLADDNDCWGVVSTTTQQVSGNRNGGPCVTYVSASSSSNNNPAYGGASTSPIVGAYYLALPQGGSITPTSTTTAGNMFVFEQYFDTSKGGVSNWISHPLSPNIAADFQGLGTNENSSTTCATIDMCMYDQADSY